jgi:hypothetical protein
MNGELVECTCVNALDLFGIDAIQHNLQPKVLDKGLWLQQKSSVSKRHGEKIFASANKQDTRTRSPKNFRKSPRAYVATNVFHPSGWNWDGGLDEQRILLGIKGGDLVLMQLALVRRFDDLISLGKIFAALDQEPR